MTVLRARLSTARPALDLAQDLPQGGRRLARPVAFWAVAVTTGALLAASSAPSPLYAVFQAKFGFSPLTLTVIFAVYVLALLLSLLTVGRLSDIVGRRPVLGAALVIEAVAMAIFLGADGVGWLVAARVVQGVATGAAVGVLGAYLLDLQPASGSRLGSLVNIVAPTAGLGVGAIGTGLLVQYAPHPTKLVFAVLLVWFCALVVATVALPETVARVPGALAVLRPRISVPAVARRAFWGASPTMVATWALGGLLLSVGGSVIGRVFGEESDAVTGLVLGVFALTGALGSLAVSSFDPQRISLFGTGALAPGAALFLAGIATRSFPVFVIAVVLSGAGFGPAFLGALRSVSQLAASHERAALLSAVYTVSYLAFSVPALVAGVLITHLGLREVVLAYGAWVLAAALLAFALSARSVRAARPCSLTKRA